MKKLLFICSQNRLRSPTAEAVFSKRPNVEAIGREQDRADIQTLERIKALKKRGPSDVA